MKRPPHPHAYSRDQRTRSMRTVVVPVRGRRHERVHNPADDDLDVAGTSAGASGIRGEPQPLQRAARAFCCSCVLVTTVGIGGVLVVLHDHDDASKRGARLSSGRERRPSRSISRSAWRDLYFIGYSYCSSTARRYLPTAYRAYTGPTAPPVHLDTTNVRSAYNRHHVCAHIKRLPAPPWQRSETHMIFAAWLGLVSVPPRGTAFRAR